MVRPNNKPCLIIDIWVSFLQGLFLAKWVAFTHLRLVKYSVSVEARLKNFRLELPNFCFPRASKFYGLFHCMAGLNSSLYILATQISALLNFFGTTKESVAKLFIYLGWDSLLQ